MRALLTRLVTILALVALLPSSAAAEILRKDYDGFTLWIDCGLRGPVLFHYLAEADRGNARRPQGYALDDEIPARCQAKSTERFQVRSILPGLSYDIGQMVPADHFDGSEAAIVQTTYWTNLWPITNAANRGAWRQTNIIIECLRDEVDLEVWGGPIIGAQFEDDFFLETHDMRTPAAFWKVVIRADNRDAIGWIIPNRHSLRQSLDQWIEPIVAIERVTGLRFVVADIEARPERSWQPPAGCDLD